MLSYNLYYISLIFPLKWFLKFCIHFHIVVQLLNCVQLFAIPWTAACQASLPFTIFQSLIKLMSLSQWCHSIILSSVIPFFCLQSFSVSQLSASGGQRIGASATVLSMNNQGWFPLEMIGLNSLLSRDSQESSLAPQFEGIISLALSHFLLSNSHIYTYIHTYYWKNHSFDYRDLCWQSDVCAL